MSGGSKFAVYTAIGANALVMVAKFVGFGLTGSGTMFAEGIHSLADVGNQSLLALGMARSQRPPDEEHPEGYGREAFIWALISAVGILFLGCGVTVMHGVNSLLSEHHAPIEGKSIAMGILLFSLVVEAGSLGVAIRELMAAAKAQGKTFVQHVRETDDPFGVAVLYEDGAAVLGVVIAMVAIGLSDYTGDDYWDAFGSLAVGALLGGLAINLMMRNRSVLIGKSVGREDRERIVELLTADPAVEGVAISRAIVDGSDSIRISAEIDFDGEYVAEQYLKHQDLDALHKELDSPAKLRAFLKKYGEVVMTQIGAEIDRIEKKLLAEMPKATKIDLEPD